MKPTTDIVEELRLYNRWRRGDEAITAPDPTALGKLLDDAADRIEHLFASGIHTCHADCQRPMCVLRRERDKAHADLARVTAERQNWKEWAEEARAMFHKQIDAAAVMKTRSEQAEQRAAELDEKAERYRLTTLRQDATIAELVAALDDLLGCPTVTDRATCPDGDPSRINEAPEWQAVLQISCAWTRYKKLKVLARAESATPAKHPDTEIVDWLDAQFQGGDDWCRLFPLGNTIREAYAARKQEASK